MLPRRSRAPGWGNDQSQDKQELRGSAPSTTTVDEGGKP